MTKNKKGFIDARDFSVDEWLQLIFSDKKSKVIPNNCFPNDKAKDDYIKRVKSIPDKEVKNLLRILLTKTGRIGADDFYLKYLLSLKREEIDRILDSSEYYRRNFSMQNDVWEGLSWILDLLPNNPKEAIRGLDAYFSANCLYMTDWQINGSQDCAEIIRAKYFDVEHPRNILLEIDPIEFEWLIEELYQRMGYETELTARSHDGGIDIIATKLSIGKKEKSIIQCKRYKGNVGEPHIRDLNGVVAHKKATKGVLICTSEFTREAMKFADENSSIELIGYKKLNKLLNIHITPEWPVRMDQIFRTKRMKQIRNTL